MRRILMLLALGTLPLLTGCSAVYTVSPLATEDTQVFEPKLVGTWVDDSGAVYLVKPYGEKGYQGWYTDEDETRRFEGELVRLGGTLFLDLYPAKQETFGYLRVHTIARVDFQGDDLWISVLDNEGLEKHAIPKTEMGRDLMVLTMPPEDLRRFVWDHASDPLVFHKADSALHRLK